MTGRTRTPLTVPVTWWRVLVPQTSFGSNGTGTSRPSRPAAATLTMNRCDCTATDPVTVTARLSGPRRPDSSRRRRLAAAVAFPRADAFTDGQAGDAKGDEGVEPPPAEPCVGEPASTGQTTGRGSRGTPLRVLVLDDNHRIADLDLRVRDSAIR